MHKISFKNFRRFLDFQPIEYGDITFLVGRNNSGKSTVVKALLLVKSYLKSTDLKTFSFGNNVLEDANIVTYDRAKNRFSKDNFIQFSYQINSFLVDIIISAEDQKTDADVHTLSIKDVETGYEFLIEPQLQNITFTKSKEENHSIGKESIINNLDAEIEKLENFISKTELKKSSKEYLQAVDKFQSLKQKRNIIAHNGDDEQDNEEKEEEVISNSDYTIQLGYHGFLTLFELINDFYDAVESVHDKDFLLTQQGEEPSEDFETYRAFYLDARKIEESFNLFNDLINQLEFYYLGANSSKQSALFAIRDKNNALAQAIHDFYQQGIDRGSETDLFIKKWMKLLEVGEEYEINIHAGESYEIQIHSNKTNIHLADKGMGSIQSMLLIFRLASIINKSKSQHFCPIIFIEEPELNLHPALQSKLAELFLEVHEKHGLEFIVETHSEYLIRKTQLLVKEKEFEVAPNENPFTIIYFDKDNLSCWNMNYREDGKFTNDFGKGFYDESANLTINLL